MCQPMLKSFFDDATGFRVEKMTLVLRFPVNNDGKEYDNDNNEKAREYQAGGG